MQDFDFAQIFALILTKLVITQNFG